MVIKTNYEDLFPPELKERLNKNPLAFLPLGSLEYHGYHNSLGLDGLKAWRICQMAAQQNGGVVFPPVYLGVDAWPDIDLQKYPNKQYDCYHLDKELYRKVLESYFYRMARIGFKKIFVLAGHYPNADIARKATRPKGVQITIPTEPELVKGEKGDHAGKWETSLHMVLYPALVDLGLMKEKDNRLMAVDGEDPVLSSKEYGQEALEKILAGIQKVLNSR